MTLRAWIISSITVTALLLSPVYTFAQNTLCDAETPSLDLRGVSLAKTATPVDYRVSMGPSGGTVTTNIMVDKKVLFTTSEYNFSFTFPTSGTYEVTTTWLWGENCSTGNTALVSVYDRMLVYLGPPMQELSVMRTELEKQGRAYYEFYEDVDAGGRSESIKGVPYPFIYADTIVINTPSLSKILDDFVDIVLDLRETMIFTTTSLTQSTFRRIASRYEQVLGIGELYALKPDYIPTLLSALAFDKAVSTLDFVSHFTTVTKDNSLQSPLSYVVDYLLSAGFPLSTLTWMLLLPCIAVLLAGIRQIIGVSVFGIFNPLLLGLAMYTAGVELALLMLVCGGLVTLVIRRMTKHFYLLYSAKIALTLTLYMIVVISAFALYGYYVEATINHREVFQQTSGIFICFFMLLVARQIFSPKVSFSDRGRWIGLGEFIIITSLIYWLLDNMRLQNLLLGYPEFMLLLLLLSIIIGRFSGLQAVEYIRFMPVIKHYFQDDE